MQFGLCLHISPGENNEMPIHLCTSIPEHGGSLMIFIAKRSVVGKVYKAAKYTVLL